MKENQQKKIIFLMGPTAAGKTNLAIQLVRRLPIDIISVDSAMVYRGMNIGTGKPEAELLEKAPHRLIDICDPTAHYSAAQFRIDALQEIEASLAAGRIPLLVGGTMLYFNVLYRGIHELPQADAELRERLKTQAEHYGLAAMHKQLQAVDPSAAKRIHPNDPQRLLRALEVYELTGKSLTDHFSEDHTKIFPYDVIQLAIAPTQRSLLHEQIEERFLAMLAQGFIAEVESLRNNYDLHLNLPSMRAVGYRQVWQYLENELTYQEMQERSIIATRQFAKRQLTWLRHWRDSIEWFASEDPQLLDKVLQHVKIHLCY